MEASFLERIELLVRARYPLIYVLTSEESRALKIVGEVGETNRKKVWEWSCTRGLTAQGVSWQSTKGALTGKEPLAVLDEIMALVEPGIFVLKDFHPYLTKGYPQVIRRLREVGIHLKDTYKTVILVSPILELPVELEAEVTVEILPRPSWEELSHLLENVLGEVEEEYGLTQVPGDEEWSKIVESAMGLTWEEAENVLAKILVSRRGMGMEDIPVILEEKRQIIRKNGLLEYFPTEESFGQVGGISRLKRWFEQRAAGFSREARAYGLPAPRGVLLLGVQGCGKSLSAKALAASWQVPLLRFDVGRMFQGLVGASEENTRRALAMAESVAPCILWVDEIDKAFAGGGDGGRVDGGTTSRVLGTLLTWLSEKKSSVFVLATANELLHLPPELLRKGRLDEIFFVDLPSAQERQDIFRIHLEKRGKKVDDCDLVELAEMATDWSGAEIEQAIINGMYVAFGEGRELMGEDLRRAVAETVPLARTMSESIKRLRDWSKGRAVPASD